MGSYISTMHIYAFSFKQVLASLAQIENKDESADYHSDIDTSYTCDDQSSNCFLFLERAWPLLLCYKKV